MGKSLYIYYPFNEKSPSRLQIAKHLLQAERRCFDMITFKELTREMLNKYDLVCIDFEVYLFGCRFDLWAKVELMPHLDWFASLEVPVVVVLHDIHEYSFHSRLVPKTQEPYYPVDKPGKGVVKLYKFFQLANVKHIVFPNACQERDNILNLNPKTVRKTRDGLPQIRSNRVITLGFDPKLFHDYGEPKRYDILITGAMFPFAYTFRARVRDLLLGPKAEKYNFRILYLKGDRQEERVPYGEPLARYYNSSYLCLATTSNFDYLVRKYFEISACKSVVLGNINELGRTVWGDNFIEIRDEMSDETILATIDQALSDKQRLEEISETMYDRVHREHTYENYVANLQDYFNDIKGQDT